MIKLNELMGRRLLSERLNMMLSRVVLIIEGRISDFRKKYRNIPTEIMDTFIEGDPSGVNKYLDWLGKVVTIKMYESNFTEDDAQNLIKWIGIFDKKGKGVDIYSFKDIDSFIEYISKKDKEVSKRTAIERQADILFVNDYIKVVAPQTHEASRHFGGSTRWCISTSGDGYWSQYYCEQGDSIVFVIFRKTGDKYAFVGDSAEYATIYDKQDRTLSGDERHELISKLQEEENADGENAWDAITNHFDYDDRNERRNHYEQELMQNAFDSTGKDDLDTTFKDIIAGEILGLDSSREFDDKWKEYVHKAFGSEENYTSFLSRVWFNSATNNGYESAGAIDDMDEIYQYDENEHTSEIETLINLIKTDLIGGSALDNIVKNVLSGDAYEYLLNNFYEEYATAIRDVKKYLENTLNDPSQQLLSFGGKLVPTVKSFKELINLMDKLNHTKIAIQILKYASGTYNKEFKK